MEKRASGAIRRRGPDEAGAFSPMDVCMHDSFNEIGFIFQHVSRYMHFSREEFRRLDLLLPTLDLTLRRLQKS